MEKYYQAVTGIQNEELKALLTKLSYPRLSTKGSTAWVEYDPISGRILYYFNPEFLEALSIKELRFVVIHEVLHILMNHLMDMQEYKDIDRQAMNLAMDIVINDLLIKIIDHKIAYPPEGVVTGSGILGKDCSYLSWRVVYDMLPESPGGSGSGKEQSDDQTGQGATSGQQIDDHDLFGSSSSTMDSQEAARRLTEETQSHAPDTYRKIREAIDQLERSQGHDYGLSPLGATRSFHTKRCSFWQDIEKLLEKILPKSFLYNWRKRHRAFTMSSVVFPSEKIVEDDRRLIVYIDASGSIDEAMLAEFMDVISHIRRLGIRIFMFTFDTEVYEVIGGELRGGGGTSFDTVVDHFRSHFWNDYGLVLTDGYSDIRENPENLFWVITESDQYIKGKIQDKNYIFPDKK